jgi:hypothetical protein
MKGRVGDNGQEDCAKWGVYYPGPGSPFFPPSGEHIAMDLSLLGLVPVVA